MSVKGMEGSLPKVNAEILDEDRWIIHCMLCRWIWSPVFHLRTVARPKAGGSPLIASTIFTPNADSDSIE